MVTAERARPVSVGHRPHLDGLRAFAIFAVMLSHSLPMDHPVRTRFAWGDVGILLFFTLSGYLITGILLEQRMRLEQGAATLGHALHRFYARRALRIFPLFYLAIVVFAITGLGGMRETWPWHVTYLSNVGIMLHPEIFGHSMHFWTLAVEEQFYLVWPFVILLLPRRLMLPALIGVIAIGPLFRLTVSVLPLPYQARLVLLPACLDGLGAGALLAWLHRQPHLAAVASRLTTLGLWLGGPAFVALLLIGDSTRLTSALWVVGLYTLIAAISVWAIDRASFGVRGTAGAILGSAPAVYIGRISYGLYVWHHFVPEIMTHAGLPLPEAVWPRCAVLMLVAFGIAVVSFHAFEQPLLRLKDRIPYDGSRQPARMSREVHTSGLMEPR
jgi:peptidoglycan/LPS O-acetylase OafA/YrhL